VDQLCLRLGNDAVAMERVIDAASCLSVKDRTKLDATVDDFERRFPQISVCIYFGVLPTGVSADEACVWMTEQGLRQTPQGLRDGSSAIVWVIDPCQHTLSISVGAKLAGFLSEQLLQSQLLQARVHFWHSEYLKGVRQVLQFMSHAFMTAARPRKRQIQVGPQPNLGLAEAYTDHNSVNQEVLR
jgi:uncharacterized membrane protein YgcG